MFKFDHQEQDTPTPTPHDHELEKVHVSNIIKIIRRADNGSSVTMPSSVQLVVSETKMYTFTVRFYPTTHLQNFEAKKCHGIIFVK